MLRRRFLALIVDFKSFIWASSLVREAYILLCSGAATYAPCTRNILAKLVSHGVDPHLMAVPKTIPPLYHAALQQVRLQIRNIRFNVFKTDFVARNSHKNSTTFRPNINKTTKLQG